MRKQMGFEKYRLEKGIYILPNFITSLNLFCGFYSIIFSIDGKYIAAQPSVALFLFGLAYIISGPFTTLHYYRSMKNEKSEISKTSVSGSNTL